MGCGENCACENAQKESGMNETVPMNESKECSSENCKDGECENCKAEKEGAHEEHCC